MQTGNTDWLTGDVEFSGPNHENVTGVTLNKGLAPRV